MTDEQKHTEQTEELDQDALILFGGEVKALGDGRVGGLLVRFSDPEDVDLVGDYFDAGTDFGPAKESATYYMHGMDKKLGRKRLSESAVLEPQDVGVWIEHQLDLRDAYEAAIYGLAKANKLGWSSGTAQHLVEREQINEKVHYIKSWPLGLDASYAVSPADPFNTAIPLKSWAGAVPLDLEVGAEGAVVTASPPTTEGQTVTVNINITGAEAKADIPDQMPSEEATTEVTTMSDETKTAEVVEESAPTVDYEAIAQKAADTAIKAYQATLAAMPGKDKAGVVVSGDEADRKLRGNPFKSWGELLMQVVRAGSPYDGSIDQRLLPLRSNDPADEGGFSVAKALGNAAVGSLNVDYLKSLKAPMGLNETVPAAGGFLVGTDSAPGLLARVYDSGMLLSRVDMVGVSAGSNSMTFNAENETSRADGSRRGGIRAYWAAEAAEKTASAPEFRQMELKLRKVVGLVYATDELLADASALQAWILTNLPEELRFVVEDAVINGTGAGQPQGILASGAVVSVAKETGQAAATFVAENAIKMFARMWAPSRRNAVWLINQDVEPQLMQMSLGAGTGGMLVYMPPGGLSAAPYGSLFGRPVVPCEYMQTLGTVGDVLLADLSQYQMIEKGGVESASSIHVRFVYDESVFRFVYRCDGQSKWSAALTPKNGTNTVSPFVSLAARA